MSLRPPMLARRVTVPAIDGLTNGWREPHLTDADHRPPLHLTFAGHSTLDHHHEPIDSEHHRHNLGTALVIGGIGLVNMRYGLRLPSRRQASPIMPDHR